MNAALFLYKFPVRVRAALRKAVSAPLAARCFGSCGGGFEMGPGCDFAGMQNIYVGNDVSFGPGTRIWTTRARVRIGDHVMFGPDVTIISGDHRTDVEGRPMKSIKDEEKLPENDADVTICDDVWLGSGCTVLKGVTVATGCVIAAGAVVARDTEPFGVYGGVPARKISSRF